MLMLLGTTTVWDAVGALLTARVASVRDDSILRGLDSLSS